VVASSSIIVCPSNSETRNLWPQGYDTQPWNARLKDRLENRIRVLVCSGNMSLSVGQAVFFGDWTEGYRRWIGPD
jgi:hypothetical protein